LKILHTGDIHLDSPFSKLDIQKAEARRRELRDTFSAMMAFARKNAVDMVLVAGDVFDRDFVTKETTDFLLRELSLMQCPVIISPGNHDCASPDSIWMQDIFPSNVYIFRSPEIQRFSFDELNTDVYGYAFVSPEIAVSPLTGRRADNLNRINLLCAHGDTSSPLSRSAPLSRADLVGFGADYAALGHIHNPGPLENRSGVVFGYCGCPEGRGFDECGPKGAILAEIRKENGRASVRAGKVRFSKRRYESIPVDCGGASSITEIESRIRAAITAGNYGEDTILRTVLCGAVEPSLIIDAAVLESRFPELFSLTVEDGTSLLLSPADYENDRTVRGEFYRAMAAKIENGTPRERRIAVMALRCGLAAIAGENITGI